MVNSIPAIFTAGRAWLALIFVGISMMGVGVAALAMYGTPNFPAITIGGFGLLIACYSFFSWLNTRGCESNVED